MIISKNRNFLTDSSITARIHHFAIVAAHTTNNFIAKTDIYRANSICFSGEVQITARGDATERVA